MKTSKLKIISGICAALVIMTVLFIVLFIIYKGFPYVNIEFLTENPTSFGSESRGGIYPAIIGTLSLAAVAGVFGTVIAFLVALDQVYFQRNETVKKIVSAIVRSIAAIPSIVMGLFGYTVFVKNMEFGRSILAGGLTLGLMIFPYLEIRFEKMMSEVPDQIIQSALALGVSRGYIILNLVLPMVRADLFRAIAHQVSFAMGATAPIIMTAAVLSAPVPEGLFEPVMALPFHLYILINEGIDQEGAYATALVLIVLLLLVHGIALLVGAKRRKNYD